MIHIIIFAVIAVALFAGAFFSKRRFGLLGLALTAGATLSTIWSYDAELIIAGLGILPRGPLPSAVALSLITILPAILLFFHGHSYKNPLARILGSFFFTALALAFLIEPIGSAMNLTGVAQTVYTFIVTNKTSIISLGVIFAVLDILFTKSPKKKEHERHR